MPSGKSVLQVSYVGMQTVEVKAGRNMRIVLKHEQTDLDEVMVVAYGTQKKSSFTGSAAVVNSDEIGKVQVTNAVDALKGKAAGVQINTVSGQPGLTPTIRIRGVNSINADSDPLIVLDGSPYNGSLNDISPTDVESMTVLKDAASTALYGARGGNGVILITTKSGKRGGNARITFDAKWGSNSKAMRDYDVIDSPAQYYEMWYKGLYNYATTEYGYNATQAWQWANSNLINGDGTGLGYQVYTVPAGQYMIGTNGKLNPNATLGYIQSYNGTDYLITPDDWMDEIYKNSLRQEYTLSASGTTDKGTYYASVNYLSNDGITEGSDYSRFTGRFKADTQLKPWLKLGANMSYGHYERNYLGNDGSSASVGNAFSLSYIAPIYPVFIRDANGNKIYDDESRLNLYDYGDGSITGLNRPYLQQANPLSDNQLNTMQREGNTFNGTGTLEVQLPYGFKVTSINNVYLHEYRYTGTVNPFFGQYASNNGTVTKEHVREWSYNYQQRIDWHGKFGLHEIDAMVGHEYYRDYGYDLYGIRNNQFSVDNKELAGAVKVTNADSYQTDYNTESWLGRVTYNYDQRYFGQVSLMRQASSRFHPDNRWGTFYAFSAGWLINKEQWFNADWVDELKIKMSYGENGNDQIGDYRYVTYYNITNSNDEVSLIPSSYGNKDITWEKNAKFNVGVDFTLFDSRIGGSIEYYRNKTTDMLSWFPLAPSYGFTGYYANVGNMVNDGIEIDLHGDIIRTKDLTWSLYANITSNHNEITSLPEERRTMKIDGKYGYSSGNYFYGEGVSRYTWYGKKYAGVDPETGESLFYKNTYQTDETGAQVLGDDGFPIITGRETTRNYGEADDYLCGDVLPDAYGGFGTSLSWKGLDVSVDFTYQLGGKVYDSTYAGLMGMSRGYGIHEDMLNAWTSENISSNIPRMNFNDSYMNATSDRFLTNASYLSLQNVTIGYTLPKEWTMKVGMEKVRFYVVGDNLWLWSKRKGLDPRQSITGTASSAYYSSIRTISGGITVTF